MAGTMTGGWCKSSKHFQFSNVKVSNLNLCYTTFLRDQTTQHSSAMENRRQIANCSMVKIQFRMYISKQPLHFLFLLFFLRRSNSINYGDTTLSSYQKHNVKLFFCSSTQKCIFFNNYIENNGYFQQTSD